MSHFTAGCPYPHDQCKCYSELRQDVGRLTRERDEWEANEQEQHREVLRLDAENSRLRRDIAELAAIEADRYAEVKRLQEELDRLRSALRGAFPAWFEALHQAADHTVDRYLTATTERPAEPTENGRSDHA